jgi:hypothetical protein
VGHYTHARRRFGGASSSLSPASSASSSPSLHHRLCIVRPLQIRCRPPPPVPSPVVGLASWRRSAMDSVKVSPCLTDAGQLPIRDSPCRGCAWSSALADAGWRLDGGRVAVPFLLPSSVSSCSLCAPLTVLFSPSLCRSSVCWDCRVWCPWLLRLACCSIRPVVSPVPHFPVSSSPAKNVCA